ncbi:MAG: TonB-dependent receptor plug domain-containing protein, partial [Bacteroidota bacterium]|nr:TonB-dependent receptor plug domain-containing protein [Bacteroidota bacterium]
MYRILLFAVTIFSGLESFAQAASLSGKVTSEGVAVSFANIILQGQSKGAASDDSGNYTIKEIEPGTYFLKASAIGYQTLTRKVVVQPGQQKQLDLELQGTDLQMNEVVVTGTLKEVNRLETPVPVEVYNPTFFKKNPTPSLFDAMQNINGVRPQLNCNVCSTGDIHINGLEGPYTMILIDGMPIVSGLSSVYGLSGIPMSMVQRIEVVKGPASSLYGSEAVGGLINVITKNPANAPLFSADIMSSTWQEYNVDLGNKFNIGSKASVLTGLNYFNYSNPLDNNKDGFTDVTLQDRISVFQKWNLNRRHNRLLSMAGRYMYEDRWGGELGWNPEYRGGDEIYGESIYTSRWELIGNYQLPVEEKLLLAVSYNEHYQNSYYGDLAYMADQKIGFSQLTWDKALGRHDLLLGTAIRYTYYDDNTP